MQSLAVLVTGPELWKWLDAGWCFADFLRKYIFPQCMLMLFFADHGSCG